MARSGVVARAFRAFHRLPGWLRPAVASALVVLALMVPRVLAALPSLFSGREALDGLGLALAAAAGAGFTGGLAHGTTRPWLRRLGRAGDYLSGVVLLQGYLGALIYASPYVFESSARPDDAQGWLLWLALATVVGLALGHMLFAGPDGIERIAARRGQPRVQRLAAEGDPRKTATLVSGWIRPESLASLLERIASVLGGVLPDGEAARIASALDARVSASETSAARDSDEDEDDGADTLEWTLRLPRPVALHLARDERFVAVDVLLEGGLEARAEEVRNVFALSTVDPLAA